jgi:hypothetical protein
MSYKVEYVTGEDIPERYRRWGDLEYQTMLKITYNDGSTNYYSDGRDLPWIIEELEQAYKDGYSGGHSDGYDAGMINGSGSWGGDW